MSDIFAHAIKHRSAIPALSTIQDRPLNETRPLSAVSPIYRLPTEILSSIFESFVFDMGECPWELVLVSRLWQETALGTQRLWTKILISSSPYRYKWHNLGGNIGQVWSDGAFQVCVTLDELDAAVARSGAAQLDVKITYLDYLTPTMGVMCSKILGKPVNDRLQKLCIDTESWLGSEVERLATYLESSYISLTVIELDTPTVWSNILLPRLLKVARHVRSFRGQIPLSLDVSIFDWKNLQSLDVRGMNSEHVFRRFCNRMQNLHALEGVPINWPNNLTPKMTFNFLSVVQLAVPSPRYLRQLSFPSLKRLDLKVSDTADLTGSSTWRLPSLIELNLDAEKIPGVSQWLSLTDMPGLQKLRLNVYGEDDSEQFPSSVHLPSVHSLSITTNSLMDTYFIDALSAMPSVSTVSISYRTGLYQPGGMRALLKRLLDTNSKVLCPNMTVVSFQGGRLALTDAREHLEFLIKRVVGSRSHLLKSFTVSWEHKWGRDPDVTEYVKRDGKKSAQSLHRALIYCWD
ncbi:hypothetical protein FRC17_001634 [Serendipita sp. 399]|nr:hypothetical protein FRC17_001634 [Serendipita sp. 399]